VYAGCNVAARGVGGDRLEGSRPRPLSEMAIFHQLGLARQDASSVLSMEDYSTQSLREQSFGRGPSHFCLNSCSYFSMNAHLARRIQSSATS